ncbi:MAG TPA: glycosyltransferase family A protein [Polyangiaceae bacterium]
MTRAPRLSIVIVAHRMSRQAENTLFTLSARYQRDVDEEDYEILFVENRSDDVLGEERARATGRNVRYFLRDEPGTSPAPALNFGVAQARAEAAGLLIDGARLVTPRVVSYALAATRMNPHALVVVPGYHLGTDEQHRNPEHDEAHEQALLAALDWKKNGYLLFEASVPSGANRHGVFHPFMESNCLFCSKESYERVGGADERFDLPGGGSVNLYLYRRLALLPESQLFILPGEGSFHQFHGGVTTKPAADLDAVLADHRAQLAAILGQPFESPKREPVLLGAVTSWALPAFRHSLERGVQRFSRFRAQGTAAWSDDPDPTE